MKTTKNNIVSIKIHPHPSEKINTYEASHKLFNYVSTQPLLKLDFVDHHLDLDDSADERLDAWCSFVDQIRFDLQGEYLLNAVIAGDEISTNANRIIRNFCSAVFEYRSDMQAIEHKNEISADSVRNYFYLIPAFGRHSHHVSIDADTGFVNIGFSSRKKELLTALVTSKGEVHYSFVGRGRKLVKISGTAKIKDKRDFISFKKILRMLWTV